MKIIRLLIFLFVLLSCTQLGAQIEEPVIWRYKAEHNLGREYTLIFEAKMEKGWTVYSMFTPGDGPVPTTINFDDESKFSLDGDPLEIGHKKKGYDNIFGIDVIKFLSDQPFIIKQKIRANKDIRAISGYLEYMTCDDTRCLPPTPVEFTFVLEEDKPKIAVSDKPVENTSPAKPSEDKVADPVDWEIAIEKAGDQYKLIFEADIEKGWNVYSQFTADDGPVPTFIVYNESEEVVVMKNDESGMKKRGPDPWFNNAIVIKVLSDRPYRIEHLVKAEDLKRITGYLKYMACNKELCLPPSEVEFVFDLENLTASKGPLPEIEDDDTGDPFEEGELVDQRIASINETFGDPIGDCIGGEKSGDRGMIMSFIFGFLGGLLALLTPCVFPMIPLTVSFFTKDTKRKGWVNGLIYAASIIIIYVALGLLLTAVFGPEALNRLSTNWIANTIFFLIFVIFAFSFFGYFEITLPSSWSTKSDSLADKGGFVGIFFMAFTLALVSFSCTGPIIGSAIVSAASSALGPAVVMLGFAIALALPFGLFAAFPAWLNTLPQSGGWMNSVKVVLGFLELALAFKFLSVADMTNHWGFLRYELFMFIWIVIFILLTLYLFGLFRFPHDSKMDRLTFMRGSLATICAVFTIYLMTGFFVNDKTKNYNSLGLLSGLAPPAHYNFFIPKQEVDPEIKERYSSYTMCANNIPCFKDYYEGLEYAREENKMVFLDFTGYGCVNCRKVEEHIWIRDEIRDKLINDVVLISLYVDDDEKLDEVKISARDDNPKLRNIGNKWADFQIVNFNQNTQPLYVMMTPEEEVLARPRGYRQNEGMKEYNAYMDCGLKTFRALKQ